MAIIMSMMACGIIAAFLAFVSYINGNTMEGIFLLIFALITVQLTCFIRISDIYDTLNKRNYRDF